MKTGNHIGVPYKQAVFLSVFMLVGYLSAPLRGAQIDSPEKVRWAYEELQKASQDLGSPSVAAMLDFRWPDGSPWGSAWVDQAWVRRLHFGILPVVSWLVLAPLQLSKPIRKQYPTLHRICGYIFFLASTSIALGVSILVVHGKVMGHPHWLAMAMNILKVAYFGGSMAQSLCHAIQRNIKLHQSWVLRHLAMGYSVAFQRVLLLVVGPVMHAYKILPDMNDEELALWYNITTVIGVVVPLAVVEHCIAGGISSQSTTKAKTV